jgi:hypothetical protein
MRRGLVRLLSVMVLLGCGGMLGACGEFSYKRGAGVDDLQAAQNRCRASTGDDGAYRGCMAAAGWTTETFANATIATAPVAASGIKTVAPSPVANGAGAVTSTGAAVVPPDAKPVAATAEAPHVISSWWKNGASGDELSQALTACRTATGETSTTGAVDRPMIDCMHQKGWAGATSAGFVH